MREDERERERSKDISFRLCLLLQQPTSRANDNNNNNHFVVVTCHKYNNNNNRDAATSGRACRQTRNDLLVAEQLAVGATISAAIPLTYRWKIWSRIIAAPKQWRAHSFKRQFSICRSCQAATIIMIAAAAARSTWKAGNAPSSLQQMSWKFSRKSLFVSCPTLACSSSHSCLSRLFLPLAIIISSSIIHLFHLFTRA